MSRHGWIKSIRTSKKITFISATDGGDLEFQVTLPEDCEITGEIKTGASFLANGKDSTTPRGLYEFLATDFKIVGASDDTYPIQPKLHTKDFLRTIPEHRGRAREFQSIWKIRHVISQQIHRYLSARGFCQYYAPLITTADCEGAGETFEVTSKDFVGNLTVSAQLQGEVGMMSLGKIYTFGPCFRAERSSTKKHLAEFWMVEPEMAFFDLEMTMDLVEDLIKHVFVTVPVYCQEEIKLLFPDGPSHLVKTGISKWKRISYEKVVEEFGLTYGDDVSSEVEKKIADKFGPTFITHYPASLKPFYMKKEAGEAYCFDLIFPHVGELVGGSEREDDYETLKKAMIDSGLDMEKMNWYLETRKYGSVPHSGFGIGLERLVMFVTQADKVHDVIPFPFSF